jgi:hypothetical protein
VDGSPVVPTRKIKSLAVGVPVSPTMSSMIPLDAVAAALGYGANGSGDGTIPANTDLLFVVKLQSIT